MSHELPGSFPCSSSYCLSRRSGYRAPVRSERTVPRWTIPTRPRRGAAALAAGRGRTAARAATAGRAAPFRTGRDSRAAAYRTQLLRGRDRSYRPRGGGGGNFKQGRKSSRPREPQTAATAASEGMSSSATSWQHSDCDGSPAPRQAGRSAKYLLGSYNRR